MLAAASARERHALPGQPAQPRAGGRATLLQPSCPRPESPPCPASRGQSTQRGRTRGSLPPAELQSSPPAHPGALTGPQGGGGGGRGKEEEAATSTRGTCARALRLPADSAPAWLCALRQANAMRGVRASGMGRPRGPSPAGDTHPASRRTVAFPRARMETTPPGPWARPRSARVPQQLSELPLRSQPTGDGEGRESEPGCRRGYFLANCFTRTALSGDTSRLPRSSI